MDYKTSEKLTERETDILKFVIWLKERNKRITFKDVIKLCTSQLPYSEGEIFINLNGLYKKHILVQGKQLLRTDILKNVNRNSLYQTILEQPGIHLRELAREVELPLQTCIWHLVILQEFQFIKSTKYKNRYCFGDINETEGMIKINHILRIPLNKDILYEISQNDEITTQALAKKLNINQSTIRYHINELKKLCLIETIQVEQTLLLKIRTNDS